MKPSVNGNLKIVLLILQHNSRWYGSINNITSAEMAIMFRCYTSVIMYIASSELEKGFCWTYIFL